MVYFSVFLLCDKHDECRRWMCNKSLHHLKINTSGILCAKILRMMVSWRNVSDLYLLYIDYLSIFLLGIFYGIGCVYYLKGWNDGDSERA